VNNKQMILYARLSLLRGVNLKEGQELVINAPITAQDFVRALTQEAYKTFKSGTVHINWQDPIITRITYQNAPETTLESVPNYIVERMKEQTANKAAFLTVASALPGLLNGLDQQKIQKAQQASAKALRHHQETIIRELKFTTIPYPSMPWAKRVYPDMEESDALMNLFELFIKLFNLNDDNPIKAYTEHLNALESRRRKLNEAGFERLKFKSATADFQVDLPEDHIWVSGAQKRGEDVFIPNLPMEEIFTAPTKTSLNGQFSLSRPLNLRGKRIDPFTLHVKYGEIVEVDSDEKETLEKFLDFDKGSRFFGEIGLVPKTTELYQADTVFYQQLLDENSATHLAIGNAYPMSVKAKERTAQEVAKTHNINLSRLHIDLPIGTDDLDILGVTKLGEEVMIFENGTWSDRFK